MPSGGDWLGSVYRRRAWPGRLALCAEAADVQFRRLWAVATSSHSLREASRPRRDIVVSFWHVLIWPNTGSTVCARSL